MQLTGKSSIRGALTAVTAVLLGGGMVNASGGDKLESSLLLYSETDRVQAAEGILGVTHLFKDGERSVSGRIAFDALTGPSPNGATPSANIQTFTRPSGNGRYTTQPGETPLDDTFRDSRVSLDGTYTEPLNRLTKLSLGAHFSTEHDYTSMGANFGLSRDFNKKNTTLSLSFSYTHDLVRPEGGAPVPLSSLLAVGDDDGEVEVSQVQEGEDEFEGEGEGSSESKNVFDAVFGLTQILDRQTLLQLNYSFSRSSGYLNDPYKIVSVVYDRTTPEPGEPFDYLFESRPDVRAKHALYGAIRRYLHGHTVDLSYRYFWDDWGVRSHTVDLRYRLPLTGGHALQPHVRWYKQTAADFYSTYLVGGTSTPTYVSADYRLAPFHAVTLGLQYSLPIAPQTNFSVGGEYYYQTGDISPPESFGPLSRYDLFPDMKAIMVRAGVSYDF